MLNKISDKVEEKVTAIKKFVDSNVDNINKNADGVYQQIGSESSRLIEKINMKLKSVEKHLKKLNFSSVKRIDDFGDNFDDEDFEDEVHSIADNQPPKPNIVHSEIGKKLRGLELLDMDAELRGDLKTSISDAVKNAQDRFNKLIDAQVAKINKKIADITDKFESAFNKFQDTFSKITLPTLRPTPTSVYTAPTYETTPKMTTKRSTTVYWKPKSTTSIPTNPPKHFDIYTTPEYFKFTIPTPKYMLETFKSSDTLMTDLNRMDADVDALKIVDNANDEPAENKDDVVEVDSVAADDEIEKGDYSEPSDKLKIEVDRVKSLDELQSQVLEIVKDTLKSDIEDLKPIENNQSEMFENPEDKLESERILETAFADELRSELKEKSKLFTIENENSNADNLRAENLDDLAKKVTVIEHETEEVSVTNQDGSDDSLKSLEINEDDGVDIEGKEARFDEAVDSPFSEHSLNRRKNLDGSVDDEGKE